MRNRAQIRSRGTMALRPLSLLLATSLGLYSTAFPAGAERNAHARPAGASPALLWDLCSSELNHAHGPPRTLAQWAEGAQLFGGLGTFTRRSGSSAPGAQAWFDQGMRFLWAFNHDEATRSFARAAELDPSCAMCFWGVALTVGPNYNLPAMVEPRAKVAWDALQLARKHAHRAAPADQALIAALGARYQGATPLDPENLATVTAAYAAAMREVANRFPDDNDIQVLAAEAMMNVNAWKLWSLDGKPTAGTQDIIARLNRVLSRDARHPGANHYLIHAVEASPNPDRGLAAAERLRGMMPAAGHMEHMPAHIFQRVGRYEAAAEANRKGAVADVAYFRQARPPDYYAMYLGHNYQFLAYSAAMEGRQAEAIEAVRQSRAAMPDDMLMAMPGTDWLVALQYPAMIRFGMWDEILAQPAPNAKLPGLVGSHLHATTVALAAKGQLQASKAQLAALQEHAAAVSPEEAAGLNTLKDVLAVAVLHAKARIASTEGRSAEAITLLRDAAMKEDGLAYNEPADWFMPNRHELGALLLRARRAKEAEAVYREDLKRNPENGWALFGLVQALQAQRKEQAARAVQARFNRAWARADVKLTASAF